MLGLTLVSALVAAVLVWLLRSSSRGSPDDPLEPPDHATLEAAEREVRDPDFGKTSSEGGEQDWGPGAPR